ncbi:MAG: hypothetical protein MSIBF_00430 [Candidatus Altiarchaeales archaeon IMC4]|nr:MAG: hypothetical protein MSIBF_00430 [Candidatus Altiarchaeales archaeon IMC4]
MNEEINNLVEKAKRSVNAAKMLFESGNYDFSVSRAYYTMFYCAEALLLTMDLSFSKHSAVISAFGKHFVKTGLFPPGAYSNLNDAFRDRQIGDYETFAIAAISKERAEGHIKNAEEFVEQTSRYIETLKLNG